MFIGGGDGVSFPDVNLFYSINGLEIPCMVYSVG